MALPNGAEGRAVRAIVDLAQSDLSLSTFVREVLAVLRDAVGFETAFAARPHEHRVVALDADEEDVRRAERTLRIGPTRYADEILPAFSKAQAEGAFLDSEVWTTERERQRSRYYKEMLAPIGVRSMIHVCARWKNRPLMRFNLNRYDSRPFRRSQLETVLGLLPTVEASLAALFAQSSNKVELPGLTQREREVAELVARGLSSAEIGHILGTSRYTVRNQLSRIYEKLHLGSRAELAAYVSRMSNSSLP